MANLDDLGYKSISDMSPDEAIEHIRQIRMARRTPVARTRTVTTKKKQLPANVDANLATELLNILEVNK